MTLDPDEQVQSVVRLVFDKFTELGTARAVFHYLLANDIRLGMRQHKGSDRGKLIRQRPRYATIVFTMHHPIYAGAYVYGRSLIDPKLIATGRSRNGRRQRPFLEARFVLRDRLPAYITWERFTANQQRIQQNLSRPNSLGTPRQGIALLSGLVVCGACGRRMRTCYQRHGLPYYQCQRHLQDGGPQICAGLKAQVVDDLVAEQVLCALEPAALDVSLKAVNDILAERVRLEQHWQQRLERARYEAGRAVRQYQTVEPENRLVARTLEQRWEQTLREQRQLEEEHERFLHERPPQLTAEDRDRIQALATNIPELWQAPGTSSADRKEIIRCLIERIVVDVQRTSELARVTINWKGGHRSEHQVIRPVKTYAQLHTDDRLQQLLRQWHEEGCTATQMAAELEAAGFCMPRSRRPLTRGVVVMLLRRLGLHNGRTKIEDLGPHEWRLQTLAKKLRIHRGKMRGWIACGWLNARMPRSKRYWIVWADDEELARLRKLGRQSKLGVNVHPPELTTPKKQAQE